MINYTFTYGNLEYFLLILIRVTCFVYVAPFFSTKGIPNRVKAGFSICLAALLYGGVAKDPLSYNTVLGYTIIVLKEAATGLLIGYGAMVCTTITAFAGQIVDMQTGLSMVTIFDPNSNDNVTISGVLYQYVLMTMLIVSGMYRFIIRALADSFQLIPVNGAVFHTDKLLNAMLIFMSDYLVIGFRICLPVFVVTFVLNMVLGILAKVSPQLNMFAIGIELKILVGLGVMYLTCSMLSGASDFIFQNMKKLMQAFAEGMV